MRGGPTSRPQWPVGALLSMSAAVFLSVTTELLPTGLLPAMSRDLGVTEGRLGLLVTVYAFMVALFAAPLGLAVARIPRRSLLLGTLIGYGVCNAITAVSHTFALTAGARVVGGLTHGVFWGMLGGYAGRIVAPDRVGRAVTIVSAGGTAAVLLGVPAGTALGVAIGWRYTFVAFAVAALVLAGVSLRLLPAVPGRAPGGVPLRLIQVLRLPGLSLIVVVTAVTMLGHFSFFTYVAPYLLHAGLSEAGVSPVLLCYGAVGALGLVLAGVLVDRRPRVATLAAVGSLALAYVVLAVAGRFTAVAVIACAGCGVGLGSLPILLQTAILRAAPAAADQASSLNASAFNIGIGGGALLGGVTLDHWGAAALPVIAAAATVAGLLTLLLASPLPALPPATAGSR